MEPREAANSWFSSPDRDDGKTLNPDPHEYLRIWQGFMTARFVLALVLLLLQIWLQVTSTARSDLLLVVCTVYAAATWYNRFHSRPKQLGNVLDSVWMALVGIDAFTFFALQYLQVTSINYTPVFALPVLLASVLGSMRLALGTAAGITLLLLFGSLWTHLHMGEMENVTPAFAQSALSGVGYFVVAILANQLSTRLESAGLRARHSQLMAQTQRQVNELVIEALPDGVLIADDRYLVRAANPAARELIGLPAENSDQIFSLTDDPAWSPLLELTRSSIQTRSSLAEDITLHHDGIGPRKVRARTRLTSSHSKDGEVLCVLFLQDQRELEARMRTAKLASMGRMSTAVAHEIRNPLAAISQANALLSEDISDPQHQQLLSLVSQNSKRLEKIVDDILNISRVESLSAQADSPLLNLQDTVLRFVSEWEKQDLARIPIPVKALHEETTVRFDPEHLRRILINLLDNARRYAKANPESIQIFVEHTEDGQVALCIWSEGAPMDQSVEQHLFEPFFTSESRSSGLGLFISRELCERHSAFIFYRRHSRPAHAELTAGNEFVIVMPISENTGSMPPFLDTEPTAW